MNDEILIDRIQKFKAIFVFCGDIKKAEDPSYLGIGWRSLRGDEADVNNANPSYERVQAAAALWKMNQHLLLVVSAGSSKADATSPTAASVAKAELVVLGVSVDSIIEEGEAHNTLENILYCSAIARDRGWQGSDVAILSLSIHLPRIAAMLAHQTPGTDFAPFTPVTCFIAAERALVAEDEKWKKYFDDLYAKPTLQHTLQNEAAGTVQLLTGYPEPFRGFTDPLI